MATIKTAIELQDNFSGALYRIIGSVDSGVTSMENLQRAMSDPVDTATIEAARDSINRTAAAVQQLETAIQSTRDSSIQMPVVRQPQIGIPDRIDIPVTPVIADSPVLDIPEKVQIPVEMLAANQAEVITPDSVKVPVEPFVTEQPRIDVPEEMAVPLNVETNSAEKRILEIEERLQGLISIQEAINTVAKNAYILPDESGEILRNTNSELRRMQAAFQYLKENPFNLDSSFAELQINSLSEAIDKTAEKQQNLNSLLDNMPSRIMNVDVRANVPNPLVEQPEPVQVPIHWQSDDLEVFAGSGMERFRQEAQSAENMLNTLNQTQSRITETAAQTNLFPANAIADMNNMQNRLRAIQQRIQTIESNHLNVGTDTANAEMEQLRGQLDQAIQEQQNLNRAVEEMDVEAANQAYLRLSQTVGSTERYIRDNVDEQGRFNRVIDEGRNKANGLTGAIKKAIGAYATVQSLSKVLNLSDQLTSTSARLDFIVDDGGSIDELKNKIFASAEASRGSYLGTADAVSKLGLTAGDAFSSSEEIIAFMEQVNKQFTIAGTEAAGIDAAMLQLTQAMGSGVLRGEEYNSILEQAPNIIQTIADYMEVPKGQLKDMAAEGKITSNIVKNAVFAAADKTNAQFEKMPKTFDQIWTSFENRALDSFEPVLEKLNELANDEKFQEFVDNAVNGLAAVAGAALGIMEIVASIGNFVSENWGTIEPIVWGIVGALAVWKLVSLLASGATLIQKASQDSLNSAIYACPIFWIIIAIVALVAVLMWLWDNCEGFRNFLVNMWKGQMKFAGRFYNSVVVPVGNGIIKVQNDVAESLRNACINIVNFFANMVSGIVDNASWLIDIWKSMMEVYNSIVETLGGKTVDIDFMFSKNGIEAIRREALKSIDNIVKQNPTVLKEWDLNAYDNLVEDWGDQAKEFRFNEAFEKLFNGMDGNEDINAFEDKIRELAEIGGEIGDNTSDIKDSLSITEEDLKYLRDIAEQETVNRFTTAEITIEQTNNNNISGKMDLDGVVDGLTDAVNEAVYIIAEGVHA